jgi:hypothetical protein
LRSSPDRAGIADRLHRLENLLALFARYRLQIEFSLSCPRIAVCRAYSMVDMRQTPNCNDGPEKRMFSHMVPACTN